MSCSPFDLKDFFLQELPSPERVQVEAHVKHCPACREELDRLQMTASALFSLRDEEIPQRIAFVSDQIFEPSPLRRWFTAFWGSTARLGFASALMLSASIFYFAATRPAPAPGVVTAAHTAVTPSMAAVTPTPQEVQQQIQLAVAKAVAEVEARQSEKTRQLVADLEHRNDETLKSIRWITSESEADRKRAQLANRMALYVQPSESGEIK